MTHVIIGLDHALPGRDVTVLSADRDGILEAFCIKPLPLPDERFQTSTEVAAMLADYMQKNGHLYERMRRAWPIRSLLEMKVPCIRYGRRKRKYRLAVPHGSRKLPTPVVNFN